MNKKNTIKKTAAILLGLALTVGAVGCGNFIVTDGEKDLQQTVATVNISNSLKNDADYKDVASGVEAIVDKLSTDISKQDLVAYFLSTGYQYVESYGYTYEDTFNMLIDNLISREILIQYAIAYYLKNNPSLTAAGCEQYIADQLKGAEEKEAALLKANPEVLTLKYFLTNGGKDDKEYDLAVYSLNKSLNTSLDSLEQSYIKAESEEHNHDEARTQPTDVATEKEDYYPEGYTVYTGRNTLDSCKGYKKQDGSTTSTRRRAYNAFLANLQGYNMIGKGENTQDVTKLNYYYVELSSVLGQSLMNGYFEALEKEISAQLDEEYVREKEKETFFTQKESYEKAPSTFSTGMDGASDTPLLLYGVKDYGFVYNILLPFSAEQNEDYKTATSNKANTQDDLYNIRRQLSYGIEGEDLRGSWISAHDHANYSFVAEDGLRYFFPDQFDAKAENYGRYEELKQYAGAYAYQGTVEEDGDDLVAKPAKIKIDEFLNKFEGYINTVVGGEVAKRDAAATSYGTATDKEIVYTTDGKVDYSKFVYAKGKVDLKDTAANDYFKKESDVYKAVSAVNELMFAYSTDTGCLNKYFGYTVSPYTTDFVKEFEYAAQEAVKNGAGSYYVCVTDYGWHIIFATYVYGETGAVYGSYDADSGVYTPAYTEAEATTEGTFSYLFYESLKTTATSNYSTEQQNKVLNRYNNGNSVTKYEDRYEDLLELDK